MTTDPSRPADGYRRTASGGATLRADIIDVYLFRRAAAGPEFLQLLRAKSPLDNTWQPVMGHCEPGESSLACAVRELAEEVGLASGDPAILGSWALEQVHPFFLAELNCIVLSPRFVVEVRPAWSPRLNHEHADARWVPARDVSTHFMWPGQKAACREIVEEIASPRSLAADRLRVRW